MKHTVESASPVVTFLVFDNILNVFFPLSFTCVMFFFSSRETKYDCKQQVIPHIKKPLNSFLIFCREQRPGLLAKNMRNPAAINKRLGEMVSVCNMSDLFKTFIYMVV